jgi:hypothetical protein
MFQAQKKTLLKYVLLFLGIIHYVINANLFAFFFSFITPLIVKRHYYLISLPSFSQNILETPSLMNPELPLFFSNVIQLKADPRESKVKYNFLFKNSKLF